MDVGLRQGFSSARNKNDSSSSSSSSGKVRVNAADQLPNYLANKLSAGTYIALTASNGVLTVSTTGLSTVAGSGNYNDLSNRPTLGTAAALDVGTTANKIVQLDGSARLPAVDGSQLTNLPSSSGTGLTVVYSNSATVNAVANRIYLLDGTTTLNLPAGTNGAIIGVGDYASNFGSSNLTIDANGAETIAGEATLVLTTNNACVELVFHAGNWTITQAETFYDFSALLADILPAQSGANGQFLTTDGTGAGWAAITIDGLLPTQTGQNGKYLTTNGTTASWATVSGSKHTINDEGTPLTARTSLDFVGAGVTATDDSGNDKTIVTIPGTPVNPLILPHIATPSAPSSGNTSLYAKSDNKLYFRPAGGSETEVGAGGGGGTTFADDVFRIQDNADATKQIAFEASGITTATTRTLTVPDNNGTLVVAGTLTDKALYYYDSASKLFKPVAIGTTDQVLVAKPLLDPPYQFATSSGGGRELLTANRTYYVRTDGSDSNNGLTDSSGGAFLTIQKFFNVLVSLDKNGYAVICQIADGTYTLTSSVLIKDGIGDGEVTLRGNTTTPANVLFTSANDIVYFKKFTSTSLNIEGFKFVNIGANANTVFLGLYAGLTKFKNLDFGAMTTGSNISQWNIVLDFSASVLPVGNFTISGKARAHALLIGSAVYRDDYSTNPPGTSITVTLTGTPAFTSFIDAYGSSVYSMSSSRQTFSGSATGVRYVGTDQALISTGGGGATYLPGNSNGTLSGGAIYN